MAGTKNEMTSKKARILIVDDHPIVRRGLIEMIENESDLMVCGEAPDAPEALRQVEASQPDLVIVDISLKSGNGIELIKQIKSLSPDVRMLVSTMHDESLYAERALRAGAMGFINKDVAIRNVVDAIRHVLAGKIYLSDKMTARVLQRSLTGEPIEKSPYDSLSDRELEIFEMIGRGMSTREMAAKLSRSVKTIETHREGIKTKLNLKNSTELTRHAMQWVMEKG